MTRPAFKLPCIWGVININWGRASASASFQVPNCVQRPATVSFPHRAKEKLARRSADSAQPIGGRLRLPLLMSPWMMPSSEAARRRGSWCKQNKDNSPLNWNQEVKRFLALFHPRAWGKSPTGTFPFRELWVTACRSSWAVKPFISAPPLSGLMAKDPSVVRSFFKCSYGRSGGGVVTYGSAAWIQEIGALYLAPALSVPLGYAGL